jgi:hypothetical protein
MISTMVTGAENSDGEDSSKQIHFLLCKSCYWCASYLRTFHCIHTIHTICPICHKETVQAYQFSYVEVADLITSKISIVTD